MEALTYNQCLKKLGLKEGYIEEELKRSHKEFMIKLHPDKHLNKSIEEQKRIAKELSQINEAYDKLLKRLKGKYVYFPNNTTSNNTNNHTNSENILEYQIKIIRKMGFYTKDIEKLSDKLPNIKDKIDDLLAIETYIINLLCTTKTDIDKNYNKFKNKVLELNKLIKEALFELNFVDESELNLNINYDKPIKKFYDEMKTISEKYGKKNKFKKQLEQEASSYEYYAYYNDIKEIISKLLEKSLKKAENQQFKNLDNIIVEFNTCILEEFDKCARIMTLVNEQINNGNLSDIKLNKLKDIIKNYSKYGFTKSMEIINMIDEELEEITSYVKKTILIKNTGKEEGPFYILQIEVNGKTDFYYIDWNLNCCQIENNNYNIEFISNNYITLKEFVEHSLYIGKIGYKEYLGSNKVELLCVNKNIVLVHINGDEKIIVDNMNDYIITEERTQFRTYEELENELINMFKYVHINTKEYKKTKK